MKFMIHLAESETLADEDAEFCQFMSPYQILQTKVWSNIKDLTFMWFRQLKFVQTESSD